MKPFTGTSIFVSGVVLLAVSYVGGSSERFWHSYLVATLFAVSICLGALFFVLVHYLARAGWHVVLRRQAEHVMGALPVIALLLVPLVSGLDVLYPWVEEPRANKQAYLNPSAFIARGVVYLLGWSLLAWWYRRRSLRQDETKDPRITARLQMASAPALLFFAFSVTFASIDWLMSLEPDWYSSIFGVYFFAGSVLAYFAFQALLTSRLDAGLSVEHFHGLGKLLFGFVCFWAYIAFSQYLLMWYANLPEETVWYAHRLRGSWSSLSVLLALGHFVLPFFFFLPVTAKTNRKLLVPGASWLLLMHYLDLYWIVVPTVEVEGLRLHWLDGTTLLGVSALLFGSVLLLASRASLVPTGDPRLEESLTFDNA